MSSMGYIFKPLKEDRGTYFVEYTPARAGENCATLDLVFTTKPATEDIPAIMEKECKAWIRRFAVPLMVTAWDDTDTVISLEKDRGSNWLTGLPGKDTTVLHWKSLAEDEYPSGPLTEKKLLAIYNGIPYTTQQERTANAVSAGRVRRVTMLIIALWSIAVPIGVHLIGFASPVLGWIIIFYAIGKALWQSMKHLGYVGRTEHEKQKAVEESSMRHHHYHCKLNPEGFARLRAENFERQVREETLRDAEELKRSQGTAEDAA